MLVYEYYTQKTLNKLMFRVEHGNTLRVTKILNNSLYHITKTIDVDITHKDLMILIKRFSALDDIFWLPFT